MPINYIQGNILATDRHDAVVNPVNTVGVMGKGLALQFAHKYPDILPLYQEACRKGKLTTALPLVIQLPQKNPEYIVNLATKRHWRDPSQPEWIAAGLDAMYKILLHLKVLNVGVPLLGSGLGQIPAHVSKEIIETAALKYSDKIDTDIYIPGPSTRKQK